MISNSIHLREGDYLGKPRMKRLSSGTIFWAVEIFTADGSYLLELAIFGDEAQLKPILQVPSLEDGQEPIAP